MEMNSKREMFEMFILALIRWLLNSRIEMVKRCFD